MGSQEDWKEIHYHLVTQPIPPLKHSNSFRPIESVAVAMNGSNFYMVFNCSLLRRIPSLKEGAATISSTKTIILFRLKP